MVYVEYALCMFSTQCKLGIRGVCLVRGICSAYVVYVNAFVDGMIVCQQTLNIEYKCYVFQSDAFFCVHLIFCTENN